MYASCYKLEGWMGLGLTRPAVLGAADRMLHARDAFVGGRIMFRVHLWTDARMFETMPAPCLCSCGAPDFLPEK